MSPESGLIILDVVLICLALLVPTLTYYRAKRTEFENVGLEWQRVRSLMAFEVACYLSGGSIHWVLTEMRPDMFGPTRTATGILVVLAIVIGVYAISAFYAATIELNSRRRPPR